MSHWPQGDTVDSFNREAELEVMSENLWVGNKGQDPAAYRRRAGQQAWM